MTYTYALIEDIVKRINDEELFTIVCLAIRGYGNNNLPIPLSKTYLSVVPEENKMTYFLDEEGKNCAGNNITIRINFFAPLNRKPQVTHALAESVYEFLGSIYMENIKGYEIGDTEYDQEVKAYKLSTRMFLYYEACPLDDDQTSYHTHVPDNFFCKYHVNDAVAHLSQSEHEYLNEPFIIGSYSGNGGETAQDIYLGFRPKALIIYRNAYHAASYSTSDGISRCYFAFAAGTSYTRGVLLLDTGFRVRTVSTTNATSYLNDDNGTYTYIAFK